MHTYEKLADDSVSEPPSIATYRFRDALDVVHYAQVEHTIGWKTWPEAWHLDDAGVFRCYHRGTSLDTLVRWADDPMPLLRSRTEGLLSGGCGDSWVIIDSRPRGLGEPVGEQDAKAFLDLRQTLRSVGVHLADAVVFDDACHWWSMQELTTGATRWTVPSAT
jgi:hypothetical protein